MAKGRTTAVRPFTVYALQGDRYVMISLII